MARDWNVQLRADRMGVSNVAEYNETVQFLLAAVDVVSCHGQSETWLSECREAVAGKISHNNQKVL